MLKRYDIKASFFIPGHTIDSFPEEVAAVVKDGHEIGLHGYSHGQLAFLLLIQLSFGRPSPRRRGQELTRLSPAENPVAMTPSQQREILDHTYDQIVKLTGKPPVGGVAPWWEASAEGIQLLLDKGISYDHSNQSHDCMPFYTRIEDTWTKIDYSAKSAKEWMKPLVKGELTPLVTIPAKCVPSCAPAASIPLFPREKTLTRRASAAGTWTSACSR